MRKLVFLLASSLFCSMAHADCSNVVRSYVQTRHSGVHEGDRVRTTTSVRGITIVGPEQREEGARLFYQASYTVRKYRENMGLREEWFDSTWEGQHTASLILDSNSCDVLQFEEVRR